MNELYCFFDRVSVTYGKYFVAVNEEDAKRIAKVSLQNFPFFADLDLYFVAKLDTETGACVGFDKSSFVCHVSDLMREVTQHE